MTDADPSSTMHHWLQARNRQYLEELQKSGDAAGMRPSIMAAVFDCIADGVMVMDPNLTVVLANDTAMKMAQGNLNNMSVLEILGQYQFFKEDGKSELPIDQTPIAVAIREKRNCARDGLMTGKSLPPAGVWIRVHAAPVLSDIGDVLGGVMVIQDISERVHLERLRDSLTALIAHDIKNHLATESSFLDMLLGLFPENLDKETKEFIYDLKKASGQFLNMANSLLEVYRDKFFTESYRHDIDIQKVLSQVISVNELLATAAGVNLVLRIDTEHLGGVQAIPKILDQIFHNIVQNAIDISSPGTTVTLAVKQDQPEWLSVSVIDQGPGMTPSELERLFDPERVARHQSRSAKSAGFGLYLSATLIERQGGRISASSELGKGTVITVQLPAVIGS